MKDIDILNQYLNTNYNNINETLDNDKALSFCLQDERLYRYIHLFNQDTWTNENQILFSKTLEKYVINPINLKKITSTELLKKSYEINNGLYMKATVEALNEENIDISFKKNKFNVLLLRDSSLALKIYLKNNYDYNIDFRDAAWNEENVRLYLNYSGKKISSFNASKMCLKVVIEESRFDLINDFYISQMHLDDEIGSLLYQKMIENPGLIVNLEYSIKGIESYYLKGLIVSKRFDLMTNLVFNDLSLTDENLDLLCDCLDEYLVAKNDKINFGLKKSEKILNKLLKLKRFDLISGFYGEKIWTEENLKLYFDANLDIKMYDIFLHNPLALKVFILGDYDYELRFSDFGNELVWTDENIELYFKYLKEKKTEKIINSFRYIPNIFNRCLEENILKYLDVVDYKNFDNDLLCKKIREFPNEELNLSSTVFRENEPLFLALIETERFSFLENYFSNSPSDELVDAFIEKMEIYFERGFKDIPYVLKSNSKILKKLIELEEFDVARVFSASWDDETITLMINLYVQDKFSFYDISCRSNPFFWYAIRKLNVYQPKSYVSIDYKEYRDPFFRYLEENRKEDLSYLIDDFKKRNILDKYINNGYITEEFKRKLVFDKDYQDYCRENNINIFENISDLVLLEYLKCVYKVPNLFNGIFINEFNYKKYFDELGPKKDLYDFLFNPNSIDVFVSLIDSYPNKNVEPLKIYASKKILEIENWKVERICLNYFKENFYHMDEKKVDLLFEIVDRIEYSNSLEMHVFFEQILSNVLESDNPLGKLDEIENIFLKDKVPMFSKAFICFKTLYPNFQKYNKDGIALFNFSDESRISPDLLYADPNSKRMKAYKKIVNGDKTKIRFQLIFNDLLRCAINSNNESLINYIHVLKKGNDYVLKLLENDFDVNKLNKNEYEVLEEFISYLSVVYKNVTGKNLNFDLVDSTKVLLKYFKPNSRYSLADRVVRSFGYFAGIDTLEQLEQMILINRNRAQLENENLGRYLEKNTFGLEVNDLIRCIGNFDVIGGSLENGNVCKELLGSFVGKSDSDTTPLDVDFTLVQKKDNLYNCINGTPTGWNFGNIFLVLKNDYTITRDKDGNVLDSTYDPMKLEVFGTHTRCGGHETHWGGRSGFDRTNIKCFIYKKNVEIDSNKPYNDDGSVNYRYESKFDDLPYIKFEIARNGLYIPIVDMSGKLIFSIDEYKAIRSKMMGLSKYGCEKYELDVNSLYFDGIDEILYDMHNDIERVKNIRKTIYKKIEGIIINSDLGIKNVDSSFGGDLSSGICELFETGSTSRFSNVPLDSDFDFMLKIDRKFISDEKEVERIKSLLQKELKPKDNIPTKKNRFRGTGISIDGFSDLDIDISLDQRRNNNLYSSEMCLNDRYKSIKEQYPMCYEMVLANVVKAKQVLKSAGAYKPTEGGMGGIGVENWILQNGGSFKKAVLDFICSAYLEDGTLKDFSDFKSSYFVFDFGCNHEPREKMKGVFYPFDNYVADNMTAVGYKKMATVLKDYLKSIETQNENNVQK